MTGSFQNKYTGSSYLRSGFSTTDQCWGLVVSGGNAAAGTAIVLDQWAGGVQSELWTITGEGNIASLLNSGLVIGLGQAVGWAAGCNYLQLCQLDTSDPTQQWSINSDGTIQNLSNQLYINVDGGQAYAACPIITYPLQAGNPDELWSVTPVIPLQPSTTWYFIQSQLTDGEGTQYGLNVQGGQAGIRTPIILWPWAGGAPNELWQLQTDGTIRSQLDPSSTVYPPVLSLDNDGSGANSRNVVLENRIEGEISQKWKLVPSDPTAPGPFKIVNLLHLNDLNVDGGSAYSGCPIITSADAGSHDAPELWALYPRNPIPGVMAAAPVPFPAFSGDQETAYLYINSQLGLNTGNFPDLRGEYVNLAAPLGDYLSQIIAMTPDQNQEVWQDVVTQLEKEITDVQAVQNLINTYLIYHNALVGDIQAWVSQLIIDAEIANESNVNGIDNAVIQAIVAILYAALDAVDGAGTVANIMEAGFVIGEAFGSATPITSNAFQVACSELWSQLATSFANLYQAVENMAWVVLSDWGKTQAVYELTISDAVNSLAMPPDMSLTAAQPGVYLAVLQMLMPVGWFLDVTPVAATKPMDPMDNYFVYNVGVFGGFVANLQQYNTAGSPTSGLLSDLFGPTLQGVMNLQQFLYGGGGWNINVSVWQC